MKSLKKAFSRLNLIFIFQQRDQMGNKYFYTTILTGLMTIGIAAGACAEQRPKAAGAGADVKTSTKMEAKTESNAGEDIAQIELKIPLFSPLFDKFPVATVIDEPILLEDLKDSITALHQQQIEGKTGGKRDYLKILDRLITTRLINFPLLKIMSMPTPWTISGTCSK